MFKLTHILQECFIQCGHRIEPHQIKPYETEVHTFHREVVNTSCSQSAPVAYTFRQDSKGERQLIAISPNGFQYLSIMLRLHLPDAVWHQTHPVLSVPA